MPTPTFDPPSYYELRELWKKYRGNAEIERLILEINHQRGTLRIIESLRETIQKCWYLETTSRLVALEELRVLLIEENWRSGRID